MAGYLQAQTWGTQSTSLTDNMNSICFIKGTNTGFAAANGGRIIKTTDGGITWNLQNSGTVRNLYGICFNGIDSGYAVGDSGVVLGTNDGGSNWTLISSGTSERLNDIHLIGNSGYIVGNNGVILGVSNFTTSTSNSGVTSNLYGISMLDASTAVAVGGSVVGSVILATYNSGNVWVPLSSGSFVQLNDVHFLNDSTGIIVGNTGTILKSTDYGASWSTLTTTSLANLNAVYFLNKDTGYVAGANGTILKTTNGSTFVSSVSGVTTTLNDLSFSDTHYTGYAAGNTGTIIKTCPYARFEAQPNDSICKNSSVSFTNQSYNYTSNYWLVNNDTVSTSVDFSWMTDSAAYYNITLIADNGTCTSNYSNYLTVMDNPEVDLGNDTTICSTCTITLDAGNPGSTYIWYKDGMATGVVSRTNTVGIAGTYMVEVTNGAGCMTADSVVVNMATGLGDISGEINEVNVYPNPNNKKFTLNFNALGKQQVDVRISNYTGMAIYTDKLTITGQYTKNISLEEYSSGVYFVTITCNGKVLSSKMILQ